MLPKSAFGTEQWKWKHGETRRCLACAQREAQEAYDRQMTEWREALLECERCGPKPRLHFSSRQQKDGFLGERVCLACEEAAHRQYHQEKEAEKVRLGAERQKREEEDLEKLFEAQLELAGQPPSRPEDIRFASCADGVGGVKGPDRIMGAHAIARCIEAA
jgi:CRISPR/Cas system-associated protein Cas10 (large subunit of type III CRISPR-Cas system)